MEPLMPNHLGRLIAILAAATILMAAVPVYGQISTPCNASMLSSFTPCMNFLTNSSSNGGSSPTSDCCSSLRTMTGSGIDCLCLLVTGNVPFQIPINRSLAISLPRACNMPGVPVQCKASGAPLPAPGPAALVPTPSPAASPSDSPSAPEEPNSPSLAPTSDTTPTLTPPSPPSSSGTGSQTPTGSGSGSGASSGTPGIRPVLTPSSSLPSNRVSSSALLFALGLVAMKLF